MKMIMRWVKGHNHRIATGLGGGPVVPVSLVPYHTHTNTYARSAINGERKKRTNEKSHDAVAPFPFLCVFLFV